MKIVVLGGGNGASTVLASLKGKGHELTAILGVADNGGSTGRLRQEYGVSAVGDFCNCLAALSDSEEALALRHRFAEGELKGHSFGNLVLAAGELSFGNIYQSINFFRNALGVSEKILPVSLDKPNLVAEFDGTKQVGVFHIAKQKLDGVPKLYLEPKARIFDNAKLAIIDADVIIVAPGNFYCSIVQVLLVDGMADAIKSSNAQKIMVTNLVNIDSQCKDFTSVRYAEIAEEIVGFEFIDAIISNSGEIDQTKLREGESVVLSGDDSDKYKIFYSDLASKNLNEIDLNDEISAIRSIVNHDKARMANAIEKVIDE